MRILQFIAAIVLFFATPAMAKEGGPAAWIVSQKSGHVQVVRAGMQPASVQLRASLSPGDVVATGADGRAMLTRGGDYVIVAPGSRLLLPKNEPQSGFTHLIQQVGTMLYKVRHTGVPHFTVETPMLAAVVKGTSFTVVVDQDRAAVQVTEGVVEVSSVAGNVRRLVEGGMTVYVGRERPSEIIEMKAGRGEPLASATGASDSVKVEGSGDVPLSAITNLTGGLVSEAPVAPVVVAKTPLVTDLVSAPTKSSQLPVVGVVEGVVPAVTGAVVAPVVDAVVPVVAPVVNTVAPVVAPVVNVVTPVVAPVVNVVAPVVNIVAPITAPVVAPVTGILGGLLGG